MSFESERLQKREKKYMIKRVWITDSLYDLIRKERYENPIRKSSGLSL